jgi:putative transcriptional regulator
MGKSRVTNNIRTLRFHNEEMTQQLLADKAGVTRQTIIAIESAKYSPSLELAFRIALAFNVKLEEVFSFSPEEIEGVMS